MSIDWSRVTPVIVSILVIIAIAIIRQYSRTFAAIAATMPINVPLGMWIVASGADDPRATMVEFNSALLLNIFPTVVFLIVAWQLSKAGFSVAQTIILGYVAWAVSLGLMFLARAIIAR
ncbi:MAG: hypothetical protein U0703_03025 [Anaerolineae bacterium]